MSLRHNGKAYQADFYIGKKRHQPWLVAKDEVAAAAEMQGLIDSIKAATPSADQEDSKPWTLQDAYDKVYTRVWKDSKSVKTVEKNARQMFKQWPGKKTYLDEISSDAIDQWVERLQEQGNSNGTINRKLALLSKVMSFAKSRGKLQEKPHIEKKAEGQGRIRFITPSEEKIILSHFGQWSQDLYDYTIFSLDTGARSGETYRLQVRDVDLTNGMLSIWENKASLPRSIPMTLRVRELLTRRTEGMEIGRIFPFKAWWYEKAWSKLRVRMGLTDDIQFIPYCLRHTCATRLAQAGVPLAAIQKWMGHKTISITMKYIHLAPSDLLSGAKALNALQESTSNA
jgi:integrase